MKEEKDDDSGSTSDPQFEIPDLLHRRNVSKSDLDKFHEQQINQQQKSEELDSHRVNKEINGLRRSLRLPTIYFRQIDHTEEKSKKIISNMPKKQQPFQDQIWYHNDQPLEIIILKQKLLKQYQVFKKVEAAIKQNKKILTTSRVARYLIEFFILTILVPQIKVLNKDNKFKSLDNRQIFKKIIKEQHNGKVKKINYRCNCTNLKLLLQSKQLSKKAYANLLKQSNLIEKINSTKQGYYYKMYYICFIPKLKQIKDMAKAKQYKQIWKKTDIRSINKAEQIITSNQDQISTSTKRFFFDRLRININTLNYKFIAEY